MSTTDTAPTPGPWTYFVGNANTRGLIRIEQENTGHHIASMPRGKQSEADARLIASAPALLAACRAMCEALSDSGRWLPDEYQQSYQAARQAIASATGV